MWVGPSVRPSVKKNLKKCFFEKNKCWLSSSSSSNSSSKTIFGRMCAAMSPKERNISKPVAASMAFAIFWSKWKVLGEIEVKRIFLVFGIFLTNLVCLKFGAIIGCIPYTSSNKMVKLEMRIYLWFV